MRIEFGRQKSQNSISTGRPRCWSIRSDATLIHGAPRGNGGAAMWSTGARTGADGSVASPIPDSLWRLLAWLRPDHGFCVLGDAFFVSPTNDARHWLRVATRGYTE